MNKLKQEQLVKNLIAIYDDSPFIVTYKTNDLKIVYCNKIMCQYVGHKNFNEVVGKSDYDLRWAKFADLYANHERDAVHNKIYPAIFPVCDARDQEGLVNCHRTPIYGKGKEPAGILTYSFLLKDKQYLELSNVLSLTEPTNPFRAYTIGRNKDKIQLTTKQQECLFFLLRWKSCKAIAKILGISPRTVESYIEQIKMKFGCALKSELIDCAIAMGYLYDLPTSLFTTNLKESLK